MRTYLIPVLFAVLITGCEDVIEVELREHDSGLYAVEAKITTTDQPFVFLAKGLPVTADEDFQGTSHAIITISDDAIPSNRIVLEETPDSAGYYTTSAGESYPGVAGREYTLRIETEGNVLIASDVLNPVAKIDSIRIWPSVRGDGRFLAIYTYGVETPGLGNFYKWDIYINDTLLTDPETIPLASDEFVDGNYVSGLEIFTDYHNPHDPSERRLKYRDTIFVKQSSISSFTYSYFSQLISQSFTGGMFSVPPANIQSNFTCSNGKEVLGLFTAHDVSVSNSIIIDESIEGQINPAP